MQQPKVLIINGPNLNLLGRRQPEIYGTQTLDDIIDTVCHELRDQCIIARFQTNDESAIIDCLQQHGFNNEYIGIVLNAGAYSHTSLAIADAIAAITLPVVEVHISNIYARAEEIRHRSLLSPVCRGVIAGFGADSYRLGVLSLLA